MLSRLMYTTTREVNASAFYLTKAMFGIFAHQVLARYKLQCTAQLISDHLAVEGEEAAREGVKVEDVPEADISIIHLPKVQSCSLVQRTPDTQTPKRQSIRNPRKRQKGMQLHLAGGRSSA